MFCSIPRFDLCHVLSSSTNNFAHAQTLSRMNSLSGRMNIARVNIEFFTGCKKIKQRRISFVLGYLRMMLWKISTAISIKHQILATFKVIPVSYGILNPMVNWTRGRFTMGFKIPYDTGITPVLGEEIFSLNIQFGIRRYLY